MTQFDDMAKERAEFRDAIERAGRAGKNAVHAISDLNRIVRLERATTLALYGVALYGMGHFLRVIVMLVERI